jgi:hypothetical protein
MTTDLYEAPDFETFYQRYLAVHASPEVRVAHAIATTSAAVVIGIALATRRPLIAVAAPFVDYAIAQASHRADGQKTKPWRRPSWHLRAELRLFRSTVGESIRRRRSSQ